jgi:hypothetical protein
MRHLALAIAAFAALLLLVVPVSAQLGGIDIQVFVSGFTGGANGTVPVSGGPVKSCPVTITVTGIIGIGAPLSNTYALPQYQWIRFISSNGPAPQPQANVVPKALGLETVQDSFTLVASGTYADALVVTWPKGDGPPSNSLSNNATFTLTCPTVVNGKMTAQGSLTIPNPPPMVVATPVPPPTPTPGGAFTIPMQSLSVNGPAPTPTPGANLTIPPQTLSVTGPAPTPTPGANLTIPLQSLSVNGPAPTPTPPKP